MVEEPHWTNFLNLGKHARKKAAAFEDLCSTTTATVVPVTSMYQMENGSSDTSGWADLPEDGEWYVVFTTTTSIRSAKLVAPDGGDYERSLDLTYNEFESREYLMPSLPGATLRFNVLLGGGTLVVVFRDHPKNYLKEWGEEEEQFRHILAGQQEEVVVPSGTAFIELSILNRDGPKTYFTVERICRR